MEKQAAAFVFYWQSFVKMKNSKIEVIFEVYKS
jgi:hypothetical protein